jgi:hypothetical protein
MSNNHIIKKYLQFIKIIIFYHKRFLKILNFIFLDKNNNNN